MGQITGKLSEELAVVGTLPPYVVVGTELFTDYVDTQIFEQVMFIAVLGNVADKLFELRVYESILGTGTDNATPLVLWAGATGCITTITHSASANDNTEYVCCINVRDLSAGYRYVRAGILSATAQDGPCALIAIGANPKYSPASDNDLTTVTIAQ